MFLNIPTNKIGIHKEIKNGLNLVNACYDIVRYVIKKYEN